MTRTLEIRLHDASIGVWQENADDPTLHKEIFLGIAALFRRRGWQVSDDPNIVAHYPSLRRQHRLAARGDLRAALSISGRHVEIAFWAETWSIDNRNGRRFDFGKRQRFAYLDRLRVDLETSKVIGWLGRRASVAVKPRGKSRGPGADQQTAAQFIAARYAECWHTDKALGRPVCTQDYNRRSGDGGTIEHGAPVWIADEKGRILRGIAHYNINSMWWVVTDRYGVLNKSAFEILTRRPDDLRRRRNDKLRRERLEAEIAQAVRACNFQRADALKTILFGAGPTFGIWSRKAGAYYRPNRSGYTTDAIAAGRYTWSEAASEVRRVPEHLSIAMPDGRFLDAEAMAALEPERAAA